MVDKPVDDLGKLNSDVLSEFDIDVEEPKTFGRKVAAPVKGVANIIGHTAGGAVSGVTNEIKNRFPNTAGLVGDAIGVVDDIKSLKDDITGEITPAWNTLKGITLKMMPMTKLLMPKSLYSKIEKKLKESYEPEDERSEEQKLQEARTENINQQLSSIFSAQMEMQQISEAKATAEKQADRLLERTHFKADQAAFASIDRKLQAANNFLSGAFTAYLKKSLELKYRHLYVSTDIFNTVRVLTKITEARLEEIKHNTGLPEYAKVTMKERLVGSMKQKAADSIVSWGSKLKDKFFGNLKEQIMGDIKQFTRGLLASSASMFSDPEMIGGPIKISDVIGKLFGFGANLTTSHATAGFLDKNDGHIGDLEKWAESFKRSIPFLGKEKIDALRMSDNPVIRYLMSAYPDRSVSTKIDTKTLVKDPNAVVPFDVSTRAAITQIIPAHLERIGDYVEGLSKYIAPDLKLENKTFNYVTQRLSSVKEFQSDLENEVLSEDQRATNLENSLAVTMGLAKGHKPTEELEKSESIKKLAKEKDVKGKFFDSEEFRKIQQVFITNMMAEQRIFEYGDIARYLNGDGKTEWFKTVFKGLTEAETEAICNYYKSLCCPNGEVDDLAVAKIRDMSMDVLGDEVIDVNMRQLYQQLGASRHDRWTNAKTGEAVNTREWYSRRHLDDSMMKDQADYVAYTTEGERKRHDDRVAYNKLRDDEETAAYRKKAREFGMGPGADMLPPEVVKFVGDLVTKVAKPTIEKIGEVYTNAKVKVNEAIGNPYIDSVYEKVKKNVTKIMKANSVEITDAFMKNSNTCQIVYVVKDIEGANKDRGYFEVHSSRGDWEAPSWDEARDAWVKHEREELHNKLTKASYEKAISEFQKKGSEEGVESYRAWKREKKTGTTEDFIESKRASDAIVERTIKDTTAETKVAEVPSEENYINTMRFEMHNAMVVDIPSKLQSIITMMHDSDLFIRSDKHGSSEPNAKDSLLVRVNEGELILNTDQQKRLMDMLNGSRSEDNKIQHQDELMRILGLDIDDDFKPLFRKGGRAGKKKKNKRRRASAARRANQANVPKNTGVKVGNKIANAIDTSIEKTKQAAEYVTEKAKPAVETVKTKLNELAETSVGKKVVTAATHTWDTIRTWFVDLKGTIVNRDKFVSSFPEKWRETIGKTYDSVVSKSNSVGEYFTKLSKDLEIDKYSGKITEYLKDAADKIQDPTARREFIVSATQQLINIKDTVTDPSKRDEAVAAAKKKLEELQTKLSSKTPKKRSWFKEKWIKTKSLWRKFKNSKFAKWAGSFVDDETKAQLKKDWSDLKDNVKSAFHLNKDDKKQADTPEAKNPTPADVVESMTNKPQTTTEAVANATTAAAVDSNTVKPREAKKPEEVKNESGDKVAEGVEKPKVEESPKETSKPTTSENVSTPSDDAEKSMFEGEPESRFHADFRSFANRLFTALKNIRIGGGRGGRGIVGGALSGIGKGIGGIARGAASVYGGMLRGAGSLAGGLASGVGSAIGGIANSGIPSALINGTGSLLGGLAKGYGSMVGGIFKGIGSGVGGIANGVGNLFGGKDDPNKPSFGERARNVGETIRNFFTGSKPKYVDIYLKDQIEAGNPLLSAKQQEDGVFFEDGSRVEASADITKPVFGKKSGSEESQCLITKENIEHGLVDKDNEPIGKKSGPSILDKMGFTGKLLKLGGKIGSGLMDFWGGLLGFGKKGLETVGKGAKTILGRLFGIEGHDFSTYHKNVLDRLDRIIVLMGGEPPKDSDVKSSEVKTESKDEIKPIDDKKQQGVKEGLTPTEYPGIYKNKQGRYVDAKGKFVKDPTKQAQPADTKPEETKEPEQKQEVVNETGDKVAEGVSKPSPEEVKQQKEEDAEKKKEKDQQAKEQKEQKKAEEAEKKKTLFERVKEKLKKKKEEFLEGLKKREEERKKALEEKKKRQAERDAVNDKAEKEGQARLDARDQKSSQGKGNEQVDKPTLMDKVRQSMSDRLFGSQNKFGRRTGGLLRDSKAKLLTKLRAGGHTGLAKFVSRPGMVTKSALSNGFVATKGFVGSKVGLVSGALGRGWEKISGPGVVMGEDGRLRNKKTGRFIRDARKDVDIALNENMTRIKGFGNKVLDKAKVQGHAVKNIFSSSVKRNAAGKWIDSATGKFVKADSVSWGDKLHDKLRPTGNFLKKQAQRQKDMAVKQGKWLLDTAKATPGKITDIAGKVRGQLTSTGAVKNSAGRWINKATGRFVKGDSVTMLDKTKNVLNVVKTSKVGSAVGNAFGSASKFVGGKLGTAGRLIGSKAGVLTSKVAPHLTKFGGLAKAGLAATKAGWAAGGLKGAMLAGGKGALALATNPVGLAILGAAAAGFSAYKGIKGASKENTKKNLGIKEGVQARDRWASGLSQALTFGLGGKGAAKAMRKVVDYVPGVGLMTALLGDKDAMTDKQIRNFRTKCENKIKKGMKGYDAILAKFNKAVRMEDWPLARSISSNETSLVKNIIRATPLGAMAWDAAVGLKNLFLGNDNKPLTAQEINDFRKKLQKRIAKKDKLAEKLLEKFNDAVSEEDWKKARELSGKKAEGLLNGKSAGRNIGMVAGALLGGPLGLLAGAVVGDLFDDPDKKPMSKKEIEETTKFLSKQAAYNPKAKKVLDKFQEAVDTQDWKTARKLSGKEGRHLITKLGKGLVTTARTMIGISTLGLSELFIPSDQNKPMSEKEISDFRKKMQFQIKKGNGMASRKLEAFDDAIAQQKWEKARKIAKLPVEQTYQKVGKFLKTTDRIFRGIATLGLSELLMPNDDDQPLKDEEIEKFRESMQRKIKMGDKSAQRKLEAFEDAVGSQKWKRARMIAKLPNEGAVKKFWKDVGQGIANLFGSDDEAMTELEVKKVRDELQDKVKSGDKSAQKKLDAFDDAVADQNWKRARKIANTPNKNILSKANDWLNKALFFGDQDSAMTDAEVEKFENEMNGRIQKGDTAAQKLLDQFHEAVSNGLWSKARKIANVKKEGLITGIAKDIGKGLLRMATFGLFGKSEASAEEVNKMQEEIESKADEDESGLWQKVLDRFVSLKSQGMYQQAYDYGKKMLSSSLGELKKNAAENKNVDEMENEVRIKKRQNDIMTNIEKSKAKFGWLSSPMKRIMLSSLHDRAKYATDLTDEYFDKIEEQLKEIDEEADMTAGSSSYKVDDALRKRMKAQALLRDKAVNVRDSKLTGTWAFFKSPFQWRNIRRLVDELTNTTPDELSEEKLLDWNNRLSEIGGSGVKKITKEELDKKKQEREAKEKGKETPADKAEETKPSTNGNVTVKKNPDGTVSTKVSPKGKEVLAAASGVLIGGTLVPNQGESKEDYLKRLETMKSINKKLRKKEPLSIYDPEGRNSYIAAKQASAAMSGTSYNQEKDPVLLAAPEQSNTDKKDQQSTQSDTSATAQGEQKSSVLGSIKSGLKKATPWLVGGMMGPLGLAGVGLYKGSKWLWNKAKPKLSNVPSAILSAAGSAWKANRNSNAKVYGAIENFFSSRASKDRGKILNTVNDIGATVFGKMRHIWEDPKKSEDRKKYLEQIMNMDSREARKLVGDKEYENLVQEYAHLKYKDKRSFWDKLTGKRVAISENLGAEDSYELDDKGSKQLSSVRRGLSFSTLNRRTALKDIFFKNKEELDRMGVGRVKALDDKIYTHAQDKWVTDAKGNAVLKSTFDNTDDYDALDKANGVLTGGKYNLNAKNVRGADMFDAIDKNLGLSATKPLTKSQQLDSDHQRAMDKYVKTASVINKEQQMSENAISESANVEELATRDQTRVLGYKLDKLTDAVYGVREATVEAGEGTSKRINNAQNYAIAQSAAYANGAIAQSRPKPKEPGLKPAPISSLRPEYT